MGRKDVYPVTIANSTDDDLEEILAWLQAEDVAGETTFHPNRNMIAAGHEAGELIVLKVGGEIGAFALGAPGVIDIFETKPAFRRTGVGRMLAQHCIGRAAEADIAVIEGECAPPTSLPFWEHMGFQQIRARYGHSPWVGLRVPKLLILPAGKACEIIVRLFDKTMLYVDGVAPVAEYRPLAVMGADGIVYLQERLALYAPDLRPGNDLAVEIVLDGKRLGLDKVKREEFKRLGVQHDRFLNYFIDMIDPSSARGD